MFVVDRSSTGAEILYLIVPGNLVVKLLFGSGSEISTDLLLRLVVNARERDMVAEYISYQILGECKRNLNSASR